MKFELLLMLRRIKEYINRMMLPKTVLKNSHPFRISCGKFITHTYFPLGVTSLDFSWIYTHNASFCDVIVDFKILNEF